MKLTAFSVNCIAETIVMKKAKHLKYFAVNNKSKRQGKEAMKKDKKVDRTWTNLSKLPVYNFDQLY